MADDFVFNANGHLLTRAVIRVPHVGVWTAALDAMTTAADLTGSVALAIGNAVLRGTVIPSRAGTFGLQRKAWIAGGANGWARSVRGRAYVNDAGVKPKLVATDVARAVGETLGGFASASPSLGSHYVRPAGVASRVLEDTARGAPWWVDLAGITHVGPRATNTPAASAYQVLAVDARHSEATLAIDDVAAIGVGSILQGPPLDRPLTVRSYEITIEPNSLRMVAWCGQGDSTRLGDAIAALATRATDTQLNATYRYRVIRMNDVRVDLQAVSKAAGLPDAIAIPMAPGCPGAHAELTPGTLCYVQFVAGDRGDPIITHFSGKGDPEHVPTTLSLCGSTRASARQGDLVRSGGVGTIVTLYPVAGVPAPPNAAVVAGLPHFISFDAIVPLPGLAAPLYGSIMTGSPRVRT